MEPPAYSNGQLRASLSASARRLVPADGIAKHPNREALCFAAVASKWRPAATRLRLPIDAHGNSRALTPAARRPDPRGTRCPLPEREHRLGDLAGCRIGDRSGSFLEDEQPCPGDLARDSLAVTDGELYPAAVDDERGELDLGQALAPAGFAVELGEDHAELVAPASRSPTHCARKAMA